MESKGYREKGIRETSGTVKQDEETPFYILYAYLKRIYTNTCILENIREEVECYIQSQVS